MDDTTPSLDALLADDDGWEPVPAPIPMQVANPVPDAPPMPCPTKLIDSSKSTEQQITDMVEADALFAAAAALHIGQRLADLAEQTDDLDELRKVYDSFGRRANLVENRKAPASSQVPLTIVFERAPTEGARVDVRSGAKIAQLRAAAQGATDVPAA